MPLFRRGDEPVFGYRLEKFLGRGQFGDVWLAIAPGKLRVALKFIDLGGKQGLKEFKGVQRVREIRHPHLMSITALWLLDQEGNALSDDVIDRLEAEALGKEVDLKQTMDLSFGQPALMVVAMPLGDKSLLDILEEKGPSGFSTEELLDYMEESAKGIDYLNSPKHDLGDGVTVGIQHCDIKPANIMLMGESALVCDFGLARVLSFGGDVRATSTGMAGTPAYMAPECIEGKLPSDSTDQYSLAITYYELRTGRLPFEEESQASQMAILTAHVKGKLDYSRLALEEQEVIRRATSLDPAGRWASCLTMVRELRKVCQGRGAATASGVRDSDWSSREVGGAPSGSSLYEVKPALKDGDFETKRGSNHETLDSQEAAQLSDSVARAKDTWNEESGDSQSRGGETRDDGPPRQRPPAAGQTLIPGQFADPVLVENPPEMRHKETLVDDKDTQRDSVRYDTPHGGRADAHYQAKSKIPWGALTTAVAVIAVAGVLLINFGQDIPLVAQWMNAEPDQVETDPLDGDPVDGDPEEVNPADVDPVVVDPVVVDPVDNGQEDPVDQAAWEIQLQALLQADRYLEACLLFEPAAEEQLSIPADQQASAAEQVLRKWKLAEVRGKPIQGDLALAAAAAQAIPTEQVELRSLAVGKFMELADLELEALQVRFRDEQQMPAEELQTVQAQLEQIGAEMRALKELSTFQLLADTYLLNARAVLRHDPPHMLSADRLEAAKSFLAAMENIEKGSEFRLNLNVEQTTIVKLLRLLPAFQANDSLQGMEQLRMLLADPAVLAKLPPWEMSVVEGLKEKIKPPIFALADAGKLTAAQRATAVGLWSNLPREDQYQVLLAHLAQQPATPDEVGAYYTKLEQIATSFLESNTVKPLSSQWALAQCCRIEGRLWSRPDARESWFEHEANMAKANKSIEKPYASYAQYVAGVLTYLNPNAINKATAADKLTAAFADPTPWLAADFRHALAAEILAAAPAYILPDDEMFLEAAVSLPAEDLDQAWAKLQASQQMHPTLSLPGMLYTVIVQAQRSDSDPAQLLAAAEAAEAFGQAPLASELLVNSNREGLYQWSKARLYARLSDAANGADKSTYAVSAISAYAALANRLWAQRQQWTGEGKLMEGSTIYSVAIEPALKLDSEANRAAAPPESKAELARLYFLKGELLRTDTDFADRFRTEEQPRQIYAMARTTYQIASQLDPRLEYITGEGFQILEAVPVAEKYSELKPIVEAAVKFPEAEQDPYTLRLRAKLLMLETRAIFDPEELAKRTGQAVDLLSQALELTNPQDNAYPAVLTDKAGMLVAEAYTLHGKDREKQRQKLELAIELATTATGEMYEYRYHPADAYNVLGNAQEDLAWYLNDLGSFPLAIANFDQAIAHDTDNRWQSLGRSYMNKGRCFYRYAVALHRQDEKANSQAVMQYFTTAYESLTEAIRLHAHDQLHLAESHNWAGESVYSRLIVDPSQSSKLLDEAQDHFQSATTIAKQNGYDSWGIYQIRLAEVLARRTQQAYLEGKEAEFLELAAQVQTLAKEVLTERGNKMKAREVSDATKAILSVTALDPRFNEAFLQATIRGTELLHKFEQSSPIYEVEIRLARCEHSFRTAVFGRLALSAEEVDTIANDCDFIASHEVAMEHDEFATRERYQLVRALLAAHAKPTLNPEEAKTAVGLLGKAIEAMGEESTISSAARIKHYQLVDALIRKPGALSSEEKKSMAADVGEYLGVFKKRIDSGGGFRVVNTYQSQIDELKRLASAE